MFPMQVHDLLVHQCLFFFRLFVLVLLQTDTLTTAVQLADLAWTVDVEASRRMCSVPSHRLLSPLQVQS